MRLPENLMLLVGRVLIAAVFIFDATLMVRAWEGTERYMNHFGVPGFLMPLAALFQFVGGLMIVFGVWTRTVALLIAGYCVLTALIFHHNVNSNGELIQAGKDLALAGGFLFLAAVGPGRWSLRG